MTTFDSLFHRLETDFEEAKYFEVIIKSPQFIDLFCSDVLGNIRLAGSQELKEEYSQKDVDFIMSNHNRIINCRKAIRSETKWQASFLSLIELIILGTFSEGEDFQVKKDPWLSSIVELLDIYDSLKDVRNNLAHSYFDSSYSQEQLRSYAEGAITLCKLYERFDYLGHLSNEVDS